MASNPQLDAQGIPVPFVNEMMVLARDGVEFQINHIALLDGGKWNAKGTIYLSSVRMVFVASKPRPPIASFDMPLLFLQDEHFNQPVFACNNISGKVAPVVPYGSDPGSMPTHDFKILFKEGGVGTFIPLFFNLLSALRAMNPPQPTSSEETSSVTTVSDDNSAVPPPRDQFSNVQPPVEDMLRHAYVDPHDPTTLYLQQPFISSSGLRRRPYAPQGQENQ